MTKWFSRSLDKPTSTDVASRFAERINSVWFQYLKPSRFDASKMITASARLGHFLTTLHERVLKLEKAADTMWPKPVFNSGTESQSSVGRTATGAAAMDAPVLRIPSMRTIVPQTATAVAAQMVTDFQNNNSITSTVWVDGLKITIERR